MSETEERAAFEAAYRAHYWQVVAYAARRLGPGRTAALGEETARDVAQEVFAVAWRRRAEVPDAPLPWLYAVAAGVVANAQRSDRRHGRLVAKLAIVPDAPAAAVAAVGADAAAWASAPWTSGAAAETAARPRGGGPLGDPDHPARRALAALADGDQEVLRLAAWEELAPAEIGAALGCSANTASARLSRARKRFREQWARHTGSAGLTRTSSPSSDPEVTR